jgi:hypothetical protein
LSIPKATNFASASALPDARRYFLGMSERSKKKKLIATQKEAAKADRNLKSIFIPTS